MKTGAALFSSLIFCGLLAIRMASAADGPPAWAYPLNNPDYKPPVDDGKPVRVPDSTAGYTWGQLVDQRAGHRPDTSHRHSSGYRRTEMVAQEIEAALDLPMTHCAAHESGRGPSRQMPACQL
jgi:hypothetical protein